MTEHNDSYSLNSSGQIKTCCIKVAVAAIRIVSSFEIRESERIMIHRPETAWSPNYPGTTQERPYHLVNQNRFFFRGAGTEKQKDGTEVPVIWTITWERLT